MHFEHFTITNNHPNSIGYITNLERLLDNYERMTVDYRPTLGGERFFTDKEVSARLKVSRRTGTLHPVGWKDFLPRVGHREDAARRLPIRLPTNSYLIFLKKCSLSSAL